MAPAESPVPGRPDLQGRPELQRRPAPSRLRPAATAVRVQPMGARHLRAVLDLERRVYPRPWTPSLFAAELERSADRRYVVATLPGGALRRRRVVGYGGVMAQPGQEGTDAHITTVVVDPAQHRRKIGSHVMVALMRAALELGAGSATLEVRTTNRGAQRLYAAFGFAPVGVRPRYYAETGEDALVMWAHDIAGDAYAERLTGIAARLDAPGGSSGAPDEDVPWVQGRVGLPAQPGALAQPAAPGQPADGEES
jgi:[ribosomal protein S18]-alanine N-acetyltransferase